jgi:acyl-coenzyme A thioesterase PaaI-like protein
VKEKFRFILNSQPRTYQITEIANTVFSFYSFQPNDEKKTESFMNSIPEGFTALPHTTGFIGHLGPYYLHQLEGGDFLFGFQTDDRHSNPNNVIHGGALVGFADTVMGHCVFKSSDRPCATISLNTEFAAGAPAGSWITARPELRKKTNSLAFVRTDLWAEDALILSATAVFKLFPANRS